MDAKSLVGRVKKSQAAFFLAADVDPGSHHWTPQRR